SPHPADGHQFSFPTRRSSDLKLIRWIEAVKPAQWNRILYPGVMGIKCYDVCDSHGIELFKCQSTVERLSLCAFMLSAFIQEGHEDRKSTRLNSSHVSISYAVF